MRKYIVIFLLVFMLIIPAPVQASGFTANAYWDKAKKDITITWQGYEHGFINSGFVVNFYKVDVESNAIIKSYQAKLFDKRGTQFASTINLNNTDQLRVSEFDKWIIEFNYEGQVIRKEVKCWTVNDIHPVTGEQGENVVRTTNFAAGSIPIFPENSYPAIMFWYYTLATLSGACIFLLIIKSGYQVLFSSSSNPGTRASLISSIEKAFIGLGIIMLAPLFVNVLIEINNAFVGLCLSVLDILTVNGVSEVEPANNGIPVFGFIDNLFASPLVVINNMITFLFGLHPLGEVIFNVAPQGTVLSNQIMYDGEVNTGNIFADAILALALLGFTVYFNAVYTIRRWVVIAVMAATPIIVWIWVLSGNRQILSIWLAELIQTIFMQAFHALTFGIVFSILCFNALPQNFHIATDLATLLVYIGKYVAAFGGILCVAVILFQCYRIIFADNEKSRSEALSKIKNSLIGLIIISIAMMLASVITPADITIFSTDPSNTGDRRITLWALFFGLIAVIPISKMFSTIFMSLLARIGTVDEDQWAARGLGVLGGLALLGATTGKAARNIGGFTPNSVQNKSLSNNINPSPLSGNSDGTMQAPNNVQIMPSMRSFSHNNGLNGSTFAAQNTTSQAQPRYQGWAENDSGILVPDQHAGSDIDPGFYIPERYDNSIPESSDRSLGAEQYQQVLERGQESAFNIADTARKMGEISGFAAPAGVGKGVGMLMYSVAMATSPAVVGSNLVYNALRHKKASGGGIADFTGRQTTAGGVAQITTSALLAPLGAKTAYNASNKLGSGIDFIASKI